MMTGRGSCPVSAAAVLMAASTTGTARFTAAATPRVARSFSGCASARTSASQDGNPASRLRDFNSSSNRAVTSIRWARNSVSSRTASVSQRSARAPKARKDRWVMLSRSLDSGVVSLANRPPVCVPVPTREELLWDGSAMVGAP